ncbi:MAG: hypothetical protein QNJ29_07325 [Rhizobiaceae bacterium]|nr:hypothetical protein [Rhizobiaceae bacterium]
MSRKNTYLLYAIFAALAVFLFFEQQEAYFAGKGELVVSQEGDAVVLQWHGEVEAPMASDIWKAFGEWRAKTETFIIDLHSHGGALREGGNVVRLLDQMAETHTLVTRVSDNHICLSMCVPIFLRGTIRIGSADSVWMFHEPRQYDSADETIVEQPEFERRFFAERFFDNYFVKSEMDPQWRSQLRNDWVGKDVWYTGQELADQNSNIITRLVR